VISRGEEDSAFRRGYDGGFTAGLHSRDELLREVEESLSNIISYCRTLGEVDSGFHRVAELLEPAKHKLQTVLQEG